jgi:Mg-chelatase subunit ChlD
VDASIRTSRDALEAIKREIRGYVSQGLSDRNLVSIVASSTSPEVLTVASSRQGEVESALQRLTTAGGTATRDGFALAFDLLADANARSYRRTIVAFVSGKDTSSRTALSQFLNRGNQLVGRRNVELHVIAIGNDQKQFGDLETLIKAIGGTYARVPLVDLSAAVTPIVNQLR